MIYFHLDIIVSFQLLEQYLINLHEITHLTIQATGEDDLIDGNQWKNFIRKTNIIKFNFRFRIINSNRNESTLLDSFRSLFWLKKMHCYIECHKYKTLTEETFLNTIPRFRLPITYPSPHFPPITTVPADMEKYLLYQSKIENLSIDMDHFSTYPIHRFTQVISLTLSGSLSISFDVLQTIMDFHQIETLDVADAKSLSRRELNKLIKHCPRLNILIMEYNPLFVVPAQIHTLRLEGDCRLISIDNLWRTIKNVKNLEIPITSKDMMLDIIEQLDHLDNILFICDDFAQGDYFEFFIEKFHFHWMEKQSYRLRTHDVTFRQGEEYQEIQMAFGGPKTK